MKLNPISRREFVRNSVLLSGGLFMLPPFAANAEQPSPPALGPVELSWLNKSAPPLNPGVTWGVSWPKGAVNRKSDFSLKGSEGTAIGVQNWPLAYWPDGSLKWTGHAIGAGEMALGEKFSLTPGKAKGPTEKLKVEETADTISIDTGKIRCLLNKKGNSIIAHIQRDGRKILEEGKLVLMHQDRPDDDFFENIDRTQLLGEISSISLEQMGDVRSVVKVEGIHKAEVGKSLLPYIIRMYFYQGAESIKILHTIIYDGDEEKDFIKGLGIRFDVAMEDELHNRHIRFTGEEDGVFSEAVRGLTGLRRDPGKDVRDAQLLGKKTKPLSEFPDNVAGNIENIPAFGDYTLYQGSSDAFHIKKRTKHGHTWLNSGQGRRSNGMGYVGSASGGVAFGIRNFWQSYPAQLDIRNAHTDKAQVTTWFWAPQSPAMDLRFYHDGMGLDTHEKQLKAMDITYEDYEPGFGTAEGVARTSEVMLWVLPATPEQVNLVKMASVLTEPPLLTTTSEHMLQSGVFGQLWSTPDRSSDQRKEIEEQLDWYFDFYQKQQEQHRWFGFWDYGDFMHTYDVDRKVWRYDVGGFAWDNSELSTDLWLWYYYLKTGRADAFRLAEAMTRHTGEVDVHHTGPFAPLGSRHNVQHWGCSAKQLRISTAANRRFYYYLTADERTGDLMREQIDAVATLRKVPPTRKVTAKENWVTEDPDMVHVGFGTDWGAISAAWLVEWERTENEGIKKKLLNSMRTIGEQPLGFFNGGSKMNLQTGEFDIVQSRRPTASHLSAVFGLTEMAIELYDLVGMESFNKAWLTYCELYNADDAAQEKVLGSSLGSLNLAQGHSRLTAFAAHKKKDPALAKRAWEEFYAGAGGTGRITPSMETITGPSVLRPTIQAIGVSTNGTAQWGLAAIQNLALIGKM
ncbi:exo-rhamnogalacturonan lyase family protein [Anditalea andensis]|uniref:Tat pathway signal sequence domain protein n=1 Tax=Anditalea andensis TaxID=1048983 RepID=A0A074KPG9_9BACT|nr:hypothetical protein [Anditalea andensis]KEO71856.1 hypothetical protein EL17_20255 [Anditalea andensis]